MTPRGSTPYADADDTHTMRGDCRVASVRMGLPDPRDRHLRVRAPGPRPAAPPRADEDAALVAARLGL
ncbi:hypothetical protein [Marmoricola endophyticus]|nr:hypothetical protein [Marmoricola endophyticus]